MTFVFWQNIISPHQSPFIRALVELGHDVTVVSAESMTPDRLALGWKTPDLGRTHMIIDPTSSEISRIVENSPTNSIHVMAGARLSSLGDRALRQCRAFKRRIGIMTEAPDPRGLPGLGRWVKYTMERCTKGFHYDFVLAMGELGVRWFGLCGYPKARLFPFTYVTESVPFKQNHNQTGILTLLFAGRFLHLKGLDILLNAFASIPSNQVQLRLLGDGEEQTPLQKQIEHLGIQNRVVWLPKSDSAGVMAEMEKADVTILPSRKDGW